MGKFMDTFSSAVNSIPQGVTKVVKQVAKAPAKVTTAVQSTIRDTVQLSQNQQKPEVGRQQVLQAARPQTRNTPAPSAQKAAPPKPRNTAAPMSLEVVREQSPAQQRAYFERVKKQTGTSLARHQQKENSSSGVSALQILAQSDETSMNGVSSAFSAAGNGLSKLNRKIQGTEGVYEAESVARQLEQKKLERFEKKLQQTSPQRYSHYKEIQQKDDKQLASEASSETWKRRDLQLAEEARSKALLGDRPQNWESKMSPTQRARHRANVRGANQSIVNGHFRESWHKADAEKTLHDQEKKSLPNKAAWLKSLSPEARAKFLQREQNDRQSIVASSVASEQGYDAVKDIVSLGSGKMAAESGLAETTAELATLGTYSLTKNAGTDLGRSQAYANQADSLAESGLLNQSAEAEAKSRELKQSGVANLGMAALSAAGVGKVAHGKMLDRIKAKLPPLPQSTVTVVTKNRLLPGTTRLVDGASAKTAIGFEEVAEQAHRTGLREQLDVRVFNYKRKPGFRWKPEFDAIPSTHYINVHGADHAFAKRIGKTLEDLPEASYQAVKRIEDIHVGEVANYRMDDNFVTTGMQGAVDSSTGQMILNRSNIDAPLRRHMESAVHENGRRLSKSLSGDYTQDPGFKRAQAIMQEMSDKNLRETVYHELGHVHDDLVGMTSHGKYNAQAGPSYSKYASESGDVYEDVADGYAHILESRRRILSQHGSEADWRGILKSDEAYGEKNTSIMSWLIDNPLGQLDEIR